MLDLTDGGMELEVTLETRDGSDYVRRRLRNAKTGEEEIALFPVDDYCNYVEVLGEMVRKLVNGLNVSQTNGPELIPD